MKSETRNCQNCKNQFAIEPEDFTFYERIKVPPPTFCPECRFQRRLSFRNERTLYKRTCDLCKKGIIAMYPTDAVFPVYCRECWYSDRWDASTYGREYDFNKSFFTQLGELLRVVPRLAMWQRNVVNSDYSNMVGEVKNVYLSASVVAGSENVFYSKSVDGSFNIFDSFNVLSSNTCYENMEVENNYNSHYMFLSRNCIDSRFLVDCANCKNCVLSSNLRNKGFYIRNRQYTKDDYFAELAKLNLGSRKALEGLKAEFRTLRQKALYKFANILKSSGSTGNNLFNAKNAQHCFDMYDIENAKYGYRAFTLKDVMDFSFGASSELMYECITGPTDDYNVRFSYSAMGNVRNAEYVDYCIRCADIFGCVSLQNKENAILNKVYSKEEFTALRAKILDQMDGTPYHDKGGRIYKYGEFFPIDLSPFAYNETIAQDYWALTKETALARGYMWRDPEPRSHSATLSPESIPDGIETVDESILNEVLPCVHEGKCPHQCPAVFKILADELGFYRKNDIPLPNKCPNCRYYERIAEATPFNLWHRKCQCAGAQSVGGAYANTGQHFHGSGECPNAFETSYAPDRQEIVYCEQCYNAEVV